MPRGLAGFENSQFQSRHWLPQAPDEVGSPPNE